MSTEIAAAAALPSISVISRSGESQSMVPLTFGQPFADGEVHAGSSLLILDKARRRALPTQLDWKAKHKDGSLRHGIITVVLPKLDKKEALQLELVRVAEDRPAASVELADLLATDLDAVIRIKTAGKTYLADLRKGLRGDRPEKWLSGPLVSEWVVPTELKDANGAEHPYLSGQFHVRAYRVGERITSARIDVVVENSWARVSGIDTQVYDVAIELGSQIVFEQQAVEHYSRARWHRIVWWGQKPRAYVRLDTKQIQRSKATPAYANLKPAARVLDNLRRAKPGPMDNLDLDDKLGQGGARPWIGPMTRWDALYLVSGDQRAYESMLAYSDAWSAYPIHYRDRATGLPIDLSLPRNHLGGVAGAGKGDFAPSLRPGPYRWKNSHAPPAGYMAYLVTGDRYYLDQLHFAANINLLQEISVGAQAYPSTWPRVLHSRQVRGQAWGLRTLGLAAYLTPDNHPLKKYFIQSVKDNLRYYNSIYPADNPLGLISRERGRYTYDTLGPDTGYAPWQHSFFTFAVGRLIELGYSEARPLFSFVTRWHRGVLVNPEFCWVFAVNYTIGVRPAKDLPTFGSYKEVFEANIPREIRSLSCGSAEMAAAIGKPVGAFNDFLNSPTSYQANQQPAVAMMATLGEEGGREAWQLISTRQAKPKYDNYPNFAVVPRAPR